MREIKFRAWDKIKQSMKYPVFIDELNKECVSSLIDSNGNKSEISDILMYDYYIPMQYTGLKDKNGKEIYEGDILKRKIKPEIMIVEFPISQWWCKFPDSTGASLKSILDLNTNLHARNDVYIIGNIHENKELINV